MVAIQNKQTLKLSKEEELVLGSLIQKGEKAKAKIQAENDKGNKLSFEETRRLKQDIAKGENAVEKLVSANINLVVSIATKYRELYPYAPEHEECVQEGLSGLVIAARKYNPTKNNKFSTMAFMWVRQAISRGANSHGKLVRLPENRVNDYTKIANIEHELKKANSEIGREEIDDEIRKRTELTQEDLYVIRNAAAGHYSLNRTVGSGNDENTTELLDIVSQTQTDISAEEAAFDGVLIEQLSKCVSVLEKREQDVILSYFGMYLPGINSKGLLDPKAVRSHYEITSKVYRNSLEKSLNVLRAELKKSNLSLHDFLG